MQLHDVPSYVVPNRSHHFDLNYLPDHVTWIDDTEIFALYWSHAFGSLEKAYTPFEQMLYALFIANPSASYTLYVNDIHATPMIAYYFIR